MVVYENECVECPPEMGCLGRCCQYRNVARAYCDKCKDMSEIFYEHNGRYLCRDCFIKSVLRESKTVSAEELIRREDGS